MFGLERGKAVNCNVNKGRCVCPAATYQQFNFLIAARSDCFDRAMTISSVSRAIVSVWFLGWVRVNTQ